MNDPRRHFSDYFDGTLSDEARRELNDYVKADRRHAGEFIAAAFIHNRLREKFRGWSNGDSVAGLSDAHILPAIIDEQTTRRAAATDPFVEAALNADRLVFKRHKQHRSKRLFKAGLVAAGIAVAFAALGLWLWTVNRPVATIAREAAAEWDGGALPTGTRLKGELRLKSGLAEIAFDDGALLVLEGPAVVRAASASSVELLSGKLTTLVPPNAVGFTVLSGRTSIIDLGTEIGVDAPPEQPLHVEVFKGRAAVQVTDSSGSVGDRKVLTQGMAVIVPRDGTLRDAPPSPLAFVRAGDVPTHVAAGNDPYQRWRAFSDQLRHDSQVVAYYPFDNPPTVSTQLRNAIADGGTAAQITGAHWVAGRFPGKASLRFNGASDCVHAAFSPITRQITVAAWVRIASIKPYMTILADDHSKESNFHFHIISKPPLPPYLELGLNVPGQQWVNVDFPEAPLAADPRAWRLLAISYDSAHGNVRAWIDGKPIGSKHIDNPRPLNLSRIMIGNWNLTGSSRLERGFHGQMDELAIWSRCLADSEIETMYRLGTPVKTTAP